MNELRQSGRTSTQMREAPLNAIYIWPSTMSIGYPIDLARHLQRMDLGIQSFIWLGARFRHNPRDLGLNRPLVIDHACWDNLQGSEREVLRQCVELMKGQS